MAGLTRTATSWLCQAAAKSSAKALHWREGLPVVGCPYASRGATRSVDRELAARIEGMQDRELDGEGRGKLRALRAAKLHTECALRIWGTLPPV